MKFSEYHYKRPDYEAYNKKAQAAIQQLRKAADGEEAKQAVYKMTEMMDELETQSNLAFIRHSIDTRDEFYEKEDDYWNEHHPLYTEIHTKYYKAVLDSPHRAALEKILPSTFFQKAQFQLDAFDPSVIDLLQKENELTSAYEKLIASAQIEFDGKKLNLAQFGPYLQATDRSVRKDAAEAQWSFFEENEQALDDIFDQLVHVRDEIAKKLGYRDFVELGYIRMMRFDYNRDMVQTYREQVLKDVVPAASRLYERQAERIQIEDMQYYDLPLSFLDGNAVPKGDPEYILEMGKKMYHELSPETGEFIDFMTDHELLDVLSKEGKASGGYCTYIPGYQSPFIFANFNGTSGDVDVLTHEAGHAFQNYQSRWIKPSELTFPTHESAEIHSMSMEFFTYPWTENFFKEQTDKYKFEHLSSALQFLPYGVLVDHFQHEVYENPEMTPEERKATWRKLEKKYNPHKDYSDNPFLEKGTYWFRQGHIFEDPFYYIDYTLAQVCAFQFWKRALIDGDETAWEDYLSICKVGGTQSFLEIIETANLKSPFEEGSLTEVMTAIEDELNKIDDQSL